MELLKFLKRKDKPKTGYVDIFKVGNQDHGDDHALYQASKQIRRIAGKRVLFVPAGESTIQFPNDPRSYPALRYKWFRRS